MVKEQESKLKKPFICEACGLSYPTRQLAQRCEAYCTRYHCCSLEITKHALKKMG